MATENKYDRQLRLWGHNGQKALSECKILCLGAGCTATETLKNLALEGDLPIGDFPPTARLLRQVIVPARARADARAGIKGGGLTDV